MPRLTDAERVLKKLAGEEPEYICVDCEEKLYISELKKKKEEKKKVYGTPVFRIGVVLQNSECPECGGGVQDFARWELTREMAAYMAKTAAEALDDVMQNKMIQNTNHSQDALRYRKDS